ncbi:MAG: hypothetical protein ABI164_04990 [Acidobacteriaceae bacterium]
MQDDWRATQNLTINLGVRYSYWSPFTDASGLQSTFDRNVPGGMVVYQGSGALPAQTNQAVFDSFVAAGLPIESAAAAKFPLGLWNMPKKNFQPRLGFAYQINSKTVLRGGWGVYNWAIPLSQYQRAARKNPPFSYSAVLDIGSINGVGTDSTAAELEFPIASAAFGGIQPVNQWTLGNQGCANQPAGTCTPPGLELDTSAVHIQQGSGFNIVPFDVNYKPSRVAQYNLSLARELPWHVGVEVSYIGNRSTNLVQFDPFNYTIPRKNCAVAGCTAPQRRAFPLFATSSGSTGMSEYRYDGYSNTNEVQATAHRTFGSGLLVQSSFTFQRTLTTTESANESTAGLTVIPASLTPGYTLSNPNSGLSYSERQRVLYAPDSNLPNKTFSLNAHYQLPFGQGQRYMGNAHGVVNAIVSGWNIAPFFLWHSGFHFAPFYTAFGSSTVLAPGKTGILPRGERTRKRWFDASVDNQSLGQPYTGQTFIIRANPLDNDFRNNIPRNYMTGPGFNQLDASIYKLTPIWKGSVLNLEAQIFNVYNHQNLGLPNTKGIITSPLSQGYFVNGSSGAVPRTIQLQAKFVF